MALLARTAQKVAFAGAQRQFVARPSVAVRAAAPEIAPQDDAQECEFLVPRAPLDQWPALYASLSRP